MEHDRYTFNVLRKKAISEFQKLKQPFLLALVKEEIKM